MKLFAAHARTGSAYYRMLMPLTELDRRTDWDVTFKPGYGPVSASDFAGYDIIVGQRTDSYAGWEHAKATGARLVYEIDDDVFSLTSENEFAYADYQRREIREGTFQCIKAADLVTVATEHLAWTLRYLNPNIAVLPNMVPGWVLDLPQYRVARPCIGWVGGASHSRNIEIITKPVRQFLKRFPEWGLHLMGTDYRKEFRRDAVFTPWVGVEEDAKAYYSALDFNIGLAPLVDNHFNRSKSALRPLECAARGIPVVASDVEPYRDFIVDGATGFLVRHEHEWLSRMSELASDDSLREKMGMAAHVAAQEWTIERGWKLWDNSYAGLLKCDKESG